MFAILYPQAGKYTSGGEIYNGFLYEALQRNANAEFLDDKIFVKNRLKFAFLYNIIYILRLKSFKKCEYLLSDSRLYPRLFLFLPILKFVYPKARIILTHHHYNFLTKTGLISKNINKILEKSILRKADELIIPSPFTKAMISKHSTNKFYAVRYLELGTRKGHQVKPKKQIIDKTNPKLLFLGQVYERKGIHLLIESLNILKNTYGLEFSLNIVGNYAKESQYYQQLSKTIKLYGLTNHITFRGKVSDNELIEYFNTAEIFVFPSLYEGFGMALTEAMEFCLPIIAFDNSAIPYTIQNGQTGILVENENIQAFANAVKTLIMDGNLYHAMSESCSLYVKELKTVQQMKEEFEAYSMSITKIN